MIPLPQKLAILQAAKEGSAQALLDYLIQNPENVNARDQNGYTPLHHVIRHKEKAPKLINILLDFNADINIKDQSGYTPIVHTLTYNNLPALKHLIIKGADIFIPDQSGATPIFHASITYKRPDLLKILLQNGALSPEKDPNCKPLLHKIAIESSKYLTKMIQDKTECNLQNNKKLFLLGQAANYLIAYGQPIDTQDIGLVSYLSNHFSLLAYSFSLKEPVVTTSTLSKILFDFISYAQITPELTKNKVDIVLSLDRFFEFLPHYSSSPSLTKAKEDILQEAAKRGYFAQTVVKAKQKTKMHLFLDATQKTGVSDESFSSPLKVLPSFIQYNLDVQKNLGVFFQEIKQLYSNLLNLSQLDIYHNSFSNILEEIKNALPETKEDLVNHYHNDEINQEFLDMEISGDIDYEGESI